MVVSFVPEWFYPELYGIVRRRRGAAHAMLGLDTTVVPSIGGHLFFDDDYSLEFYDLKKIYQTVSGSTTSNSW